MSADDFAVFPGLLIALTGIGFGLRGSLCKGAVPFRRSLTDDEIQATTRYAWTLFAVVGLVCGGLGVWIIGAN